MFCGAFISVLLGVQPFCSEFNYTTTIEPLLQGDESMVGRAIFDAYLEQVSQLDTDNPKAENRSDEIRIVQAKEVKADSLFDGFLESIAVLNDSKSLQTGIMHVRRTVLLEAREYVNPWPETRWPDIASFTQRNSDVVFRVNDFILEHADADRQDRFAAAIAKVEGDSEECAKAEKRTMQRWAAYDSIVESGDALAAFDTRFTTLPKNAPVIELFIRIGKTVEDPDKIQLVQNQFAFYNSVYSNQKRALVGLIKNVRIHEGVDPLSIGCGLQSKSKNEILQKCAEIHELNRSTIELMLGVLTAEQRQQLSISE